LHYSGFTAIGLLQGEKVRMTVAEPPELYDPHVFVIILQSQTTLDVGCPWGTQNHPLSSFEQDSLQKAL
jgi:hypothetical protein